MAAWARTPFTCASTARCRRRARRTRAAAARRPSACTGSTPRRDSACERDARLALPALDRPPRRRQAGARKHAGRVSARCRPSATAPSNATSSSAPTACPSCCTTPRWNAPPTASGIAGEQDWSELSRIDAGGWHSAALRRRAAADAWQRLPRYCAANRFALNIEIKPTPGTRRTPARGGRRGWRSCGTATRAHAAAQLVPPRGAAGGTAQAAPRLRACAAARQPPARLAGHGTAAGLRGAWSRTTELMDRAAARMRCMAPACARWSIPSTKPPAGADLDRHGYRRHRSPMPSTALRRTPCPAETRLSGLHPNCGSRR